MAATDKLQVRVVGKHHETDRIALFELAAEAGGRLPSFSAGSHIDVHIRPGLARQYSLCNDPGETHRYMIAVAREAESRGGSAAMHDRVAAGDVLQISAPKNHFPLVHGNRHNLLLAAGIGITPILCMAERLATIGEEFALHYATRSVAATAFRQRIAESSFAGRVTHHYSEDPASGRMDLGGILDALPADAHVYACGPKGFIDEMCDRARARGLGQSQRHFERFGAEVAVCDEDAAFDVKLASSARIIRIERERTVVEALAAAGVSVETSCEQGVCGTCLTRVLDGEPDHRDSYLTPAERAKNDQFLPCTSRARSAMLVLDL